MNYRRHGSKPALGLWTLVAIADIAFLASAGPLAAVLTVVALVTVVAALVLAALLIRRGGRSRAANLGPARPREAALTGVLSTRPGA